jgi:hypothetical protein
MKLIDRLLGKSEPKPVPPPAPAAPPRLVTTRNVLIKSLNPVRENARLTPGDIVQLTAQKDPSENGMYVVQDDYRLRRADTSQQQPG